MQEVWLRRRANDHKDALRLILEPRFQINAVDPPKDVLLGTFTKEIEPFVKAYNEYIRLSNKIV